MTTMAENLRFYRERAGYTQEELAHKAGLTKDYISKIERNEQGNPRRQTVLALAKALGIEPIDLEYGEFEKSARELSSIGKDPIFAGTMPVIGYATGGPIDCHWDDGYPVGDGMEAILRPADLSPNAYALKILGDSMAPKYEEGEIVIVDPVKPYESGDYAVVRLKTGEVMLKKVSIMDGHIILSSINSSYSQILCRKKDVVFVHPVIYSKRKV